MPTYEFTANATDSADPSKTGEITADNPTEAARLVKAKYSYRVKVTLVGLAPDPRSPGRNIMSKQLLLIDG